MREEAEVLFQKVSELTDAKERAAFLDHACRGDPELLVQVERLLADAQPAESYFAEFHPDSPEDTQGSGEM